MEGNNKGRGKVSLGERKTNRIGSKLPRFLPRWLFWAHTATGHSHHRGMALTRDGYHFHVVMEQPRELGLGSTPTEERVKLVCSAGVLSSMGGRRQAFESIHSAQTSGGNRMPCWRKKGKTLCPLKAWHKKQKQKKTADKNKGSRSRRENHNQT